MERPLDRLKLETQYYTIKFEDAQLGMQTDGDWMASLAGHEFDSDWLKFVNKIVGIGSANRRTVDDDLDPAILDARREFFEDVLGWGDADSPFNETYLKLKERAPVLIPLATFIGTQRVLDGLGIDTAKLTKQHEKILWTGPENLVERVECLESLDLEPRRIFEGSYRSLSSAPANFRRIFKALSAEPTLNVKDILHKAPELLTIDAQELRARIRYLFSCGITPQTINKHGTILHYPLESLRARIKLLSDKGLDVAKVINGNGMFVVGTSEDLISARFTAVEDMGLDPIRTINGNPSLLNSNTQLTRAKLLLIKSILRYSGSSIDPLEAVNEMPLLLGRSKDKLRATTRMLTGSVDPEYIASLPAKKMERFAIFPLDTVFTGVARHKMADPPREAGITAIDLLHIQREIPAARRRQHNLDLLADTTSRNGIGAHTIRIYLEHSPLTEKELANYPELAELA